MSAHLPPALREATARLTETVASKDVAARSAALTETYRGGSGSERVRDERDVAAYLTTRLPATYAAIAAVLDAVRGRAPSFAPKRLLDVGAGPGTASWAAVDICPDIDSVTMLDRNPHLIAAARTLAQSSHSSSLANATCIEADLTEFFPPPLAGEVPPRAAEGGSSDRNYDLIIAAYTLAELPPQKLAEIISALWAACTGMLVIVEPGTPSGYARMLACRAKLIAEGARIVAPCPGPYPCPIAAPDWCHFSARLPRSRAHMRAKAARVPFEDEKFSYLAVAREGIALHPAEARILAPPQVGKPGLRLKLCTGGTIVERTVLKRDPAAYKPVARKTWGDAL